MLYSIQFLCSVVATFARLVRALRNAMASVLCSQPVSVPAVSSPASAAPPQLSLRRKATTPVQLVVAAAVGDVLQNKRAAKEHLAAVIVPATVAVAAACSGSRCSVGVEQVERATKAKAALAARRRPSMLVIPVAPEASAPPAAAWGVAMAEKEAEVEVEGDGFCLASRRGARHSMEDGYAVVTHKIDGDSRLAFYGVYDGHGGRAAVDLVTDRLGKNVVARVLAAITSEKGDAEVSPSADAVTSAIRAAYLATDGEFLGQGTRGGSCAATALVKDGDLYVANLGDCRVVMSRDGEAAALTSDHTPADEDERMRIESTGGYVSCGSNGVWRVQDCLAVSRAFGDAGLKRWVISDPEVARLPLTAGCEFLVIASDGLWNKVSNQEAVDTVSRSNAAAAACCKELVDMARGRGSRDDITVMVVDLKRYAR